MELAGSDARRNFDLAREVLHSQVEPVVVSVEELTPERVGGMFDVVLFLVCSTTPLTRWATYGAFAASRAVWRSSRPLSTCST